MNTENLEEIVRKNLDPQYTLCETVLSDAQREVFRVTSTSAPGRQLALIIDTSDQQESNLRRYREAQFLNHPNLLGISSTGEISDVGADAKLSYPYLLTACPDEILSGKLQSYASALGVILQVATQILAGLEYLHSENLIYCGLRAGSVWRVADEWKLSDYSQLRVPGMDSPENSRRLFIQKGLIAPPEVYLGQASPAWDVWSFGAMLGRILNPVRNRNAPDNDSPQTLTLPAEIQEMIANCSDPEPGARPSVGDLRRFFERQEQQYRGRRAAAAAVSATLPMKPSGKPELESGPAVATPVRHSALAGPEIAVPPRFRPITSPRPRDISHGGAKAEQALPSRWRKLLPALVICICLLLALILIGRKSVAARSGAMVPKPAPVVASLPSPPPHVRPETPKANTDPQPTQSGDAQSAQEEKAQISAVLERWASSTRKREVTNLVSCYGPVVDTYYGRHNVTSSQLEAEKERVFSEIGPVQAFGMDQLKFDHLGDGWAVISFDKHWAFGNPAGYAGTAREQLVLREFGEEWKITSERELKVYNVRNRRRVAA